MREPCRRVNGQSLAKPRVAHLSTKHVSKRHQQVGVGKDNELLAVWLGTSLIDRKDLRYSLNRDFLTRLVEI